TRARDVQNMESKLIIIIFLMMSEAQSISFASALADFNHSVLINSAYDRNHPHSRLSLWYNKKTSGITPNSYMAGLDFYIICLSNIDTSHDGCSRHSNFASAVHNIQLSFMEKRLGLKHTALISVNLYTQCDHFNGFTTDAGACNHSPISYYTYTSTEE
ncbi:hypothetical protein ACGLWP_004869, partial [Salmonella enterica subsp. enterica serovar Enteritidis]